MTSLLKGLRAEIEKKNVLIVVGAGVSIGATNNNPLASWTGLLKHGVERCLELPLILPGDWANRVRAEIDSEDIDDLLSAAEKISSKLGYPNGGEYRRWLRETVGSLSVRDQSLIKALHFLDVPLLTTNYDSLIEQVTGFSPVSWKDNWRVQRILRGDDKGILHLHGFWEDSSSVILGIRSYEGVLGDEFAQALLRYGFLSKSLVFVGFGAGLRDPNFNALRKWSQKVLVGSEYRHYRLVREDEVESIKKDHAEERIVPLSFGKEYVDLIPFLEQLRPPSSVPDSRLSAFDEQVAPIDRRRADLEAKRNSLSSGEYLLELSKIAVDLWDLGARRSAWSMLNSKFREGASSLGSEERTRIGLMLASWMVEDHAANAGISMLQNLESDVQALPSEDPRKLAFLDLQSKYYINLCAYPEAVSTINQALGLAKDPEVKERLKAELAEMHLLQGELDKALDESAKD